MPMRRPAPSSDPVYSCPAMASADELEAAEEVAELLLLRAQVGDVAAPCRHFEREPLDDLDPVVLQPDHLARIVGQEAHLAHAEIAQDLRADPVVPQVGLEAELEVGLDRVAS